MGLRGRQLTIDAAVLAVLGAILAVAAPLFLFSIGGASVASVFETWLLNAVVLGSGVVTIVRGARSESPLAWSLTGTGFLLWGLGNIYWAMFLKDLAVVPVPSLADVGWLSVYPFWFTALVVLARRGGGRALARWIDASLAALAVASVVALLVVQPVFSALRGQGMAFAIGISYPIGDLLLVGLAVGALVMNGSGRDRRWMLITGGFAAFALSDCVYLMQSTFGGFTPGTVVSLGWPLAAWLIAVASGTAPLRSPAETGNDGLRSLVIPSASGVVGLTVLVWGSVSASRGLATVTATLVMSVVIARLVVVVRENQAMLRSSRGEATTDALTGIGNRRRLTEDFASLRSDVASTRLLVLFDMDGFKRFNDTFGHLEGDALLIRTAQRLSEAAAGRGSAYRLGGDEFCVILWTSVKRAHTDVAALATLLMETHDDVAVSASAGYAEIPSGGGELSDVLRVADRRMYAVKHAQQSFVA